jgi:putative glutamine amidotransferase
LEERLNERIRAELAALKKLRLVSGSMVQRGPLTDPAIIRVGVTFRTDSVGKVHIEHDCLAISAINRMVDSRGRPRFPFEVVPITLPRGANGGETPPREAKWSDLDDIDLLYIPGAPTANDTQEGTSSSSELYAEERNFNRLEPPVRKPKEKDRDFLQRKEKYLRVNGEHVGRAAYELRLLGVAKSRGIPILAVCAGSWRLLESYGGKVRTLEVVPRGRHKAKETADTWKITNALSMVGGRTLVQLMLSKRYEAIRPPSHTPMIKVTTPEGETRLLSTVEGVNSTHWAVASTRTSPEIRLTTPEGVSRVLVERRQTLAPGTDDPSLLLEISAFDVDTDTVEAFESLYGAPAMGIQWHPESYLPGMLGQDSGGPDARGVSLALFEFMIFAAQCRRRRADLGASLSVEGRAFDLLCQSVKLCASKQYVGAGNAYISATQLLSRDKWSGRMMAVDEVFELLDQSEKEMQAVRPVAAGMIYRDAQSRMREYGVHI